MEGKKKNFAFWHFLSLTFTSFQSGTPKSCTQSLIFSPVTNLLWVLPADDIAFKRSKVSGWKTDSTSRLLESEKKHLKERARLPSHIWSHLCPITDRMLVALFLIHLLSFQRKILRKALTLTTFIFPPLRYTSALCSVSKCELCEKIVGRLCRAFKHLDLGEESTALLAILQRRSNGDDRKQQRNKETKKQTNKKTTKKEK